MVGPSYRKNIPFRYHHLESTNIKELKLAKEITEKRLKFWWAHYSDLAHQRHLIESELKKSIVQNSNEFTINNWQRAVNYKYSLHPLCTIGSHQFIGGRFNYGNSINGELAPFPALYVAKDKNTALQEYIGKAPISGNSNLTPLDLALTSPISQSIVSISGKLEKVFDLTNKSNLTEFVNLISKFKISKYLTQLAREARLNKFSLPLIIKSTDIMLDSLLDIHWRTAPVNYDIPSNSQIFGHLCYIAGIEGIVYPSKLTGEDCIAIFPNNFPKTSSYIKLDGELPHDKIPSIINKDNYNLCEINDKDII
jgi:hypothetical protein